MSITVSVEVSQLIGLTGAEGKNIPAGIKMDTCCVSGEF